MSRTTVDALARQLRWLHIQPRPRDQPTADPHHHHSAPIERRAVGLRRRPVPLAPGDLAVLAHRAQLRVEVLKRREQLRPVLANLLHTAKRAIRVHRLLAHIPGVEARDKGLDVVRVLCTCMSCWRYPVGWLTSLLLRSLMAWIGSAAHWVHLAPGRDLIGTWPSASIQACPPVGLVSSISEREK